MSIVSCTEDLRQDRKPVFTKLQFRVWNQHENSFSNPFECADSYHRFSLTELDNGPQLDKSVLGDGPAYYRIRGVASIECVKYTGRAKDGKVIPTQAVGIVGVQHTKLVSGKSSSYDSTASTGSYNELDHGPTLIGAGNQSGQILWDGGDDFTAERPSR